VRRLGELPSGGDSFLRGSGSRAEPLLGYGLACTALVLLELGGSDSVAGWSDRDARVGRGGRSSRTVMDRGGVKTWPGKRLRLGLGRWGLGWH